MNIQCVNCGEWICDTAHIRVIGGDSEFICKKKGFQRDPMASELKCSPSAIQNLADAIGTMDAEERKTLTDEIQRLNLQLSEAVEFRKKVCNALDCHNAYILETIEQLKRFRDEAYSVRDKAVAKNHELAESVSEMDGKLQESNRLIHDVKRKNADLTIKLMKILGAFKRGTPIGHKFCECVKCNELYEAVHAATMYEMPGDAESQETLKRVVPVPKKWAVCGWCAGGHDDPEGKCPKCAGAKGKWIEDSQ